LIAEWSRFCWLTLDETLTPEMRAANRSRTAARLGMMEIVRNVPLSFILMVTFGAQFGFSMMQSTFAIFGEDVLFQGFHGNDVLLRVGLLLSVVGIGQLITQLFILRWALRHWREYSLVVGGGVLRGVGLLILSLIPNPLVSIIGLGMFAIGSGLQLPSLQSLAVNSVSGQVRGVVMGVFQSSQNLGIIFGSAIAGAIYAISPLYPNLVGGVLFFIMLVPSLLLTRQQVALAKR
jgi:MFS family permease